MKNIIIACIMMAAAIPALPLTLDFESGKAEGFEINGEYARIGEKSPVSGKRSLMINSTEAPSEWTWCFRTASGVLKAGAEYTVTLTVRAVSLDPEGSMVHCLVRLLDPPDYKLDIGVFNVTETGDKKVTMTFKVPADRPNYAFQIHTRYKVKAIIDDIVITEKGAPAAAPAVSAGVTKIDFEQGKQPTFTCVEPYGRVSGESVIAGKGSLLIDSYSGENEWTPCFMTATGMLKPNTEYTVTFNVRTLSLENDSYVHCLIRPLDPPDPKFDLGVFNIKETGDTKVTLSFKTPADPATYALQIHTHFKAKAVVDDIVITAKGAPKAVAAVPAASGAIKLDFESGKQPSFTLVAGNATIGTADAIAGGSSLIIDTTGSANEWNPCFMTAPGVLKPDVSYTISFMYKTITGDEESSYLHCIVRQPDADDKADLVHVDIKDGGGTAKRFEAKFKVPAGAANYLFQLHTRNKVRAIIDDIIITPTK
ncbi:MAG: hypothetical protein HZC28_18795 [Spirochaetes bacterium]|nr:hypothetical protein [Spirochaetota bacterium]